jgi:hypothetical protein
VHLGRSKVVSASIQSTISLTMAEAYAVFDPYRRPDDVPRRQRVVQEPKPPKPPKAPKAPKAPRQRWFKSKICLEEPTGTPSETWETRSEGEALGRHASRAPSFMSDRETSSEAHSSLVETEESSAEHDPPIAHAPSWPIHEGATWPGAATSVVVVASTKGGRFTGRRPAKELEWNEVRVDDALSLLRELRPAPVDVSAVGASNGDE